jgi:hypothetical protein
VGVLCSQEQHRDVDAVCTQLAQDGQAVDARHQYVEDHQVGSHLPDPVDGLAAAASRAHLESGVPQAGRQQLDDVRLVVDDQQLRARLFCHVVEDGLIAPRQAVRML